MAEHNTLTDPELHEPKGVSAAAEGQVYVADGAGSGTWQAQNSTGTHVGFADYNDLATATTPLSIVGGASAIYIPNDASGPQTTEVYLPAGITSVWDGLAGKFDFSQLSNGDMLDIRLALEVTTTSANQTVNVDLEMATDSVSPFDVHFITSNFKTAGTYQISRFNGIYVGSDFVRLNKARFKMDSDSNATVRVLGWYCKVLTNG